VVDILESRAVTLDWAEAAEAMVVIGPAMVVLVVADL
jgi:hypothetical protein|tara:strand:- start:545 stop:655 length:111 start_codon:yes stop_codon:yes gene_type:complete